MVANVYIFFNGNCEEALTFYAKALGGNIPMIVRYKDAPPSPENTISPDEMDKIMHARVEFAGGMIMASDAPSDRYHKPGGFSISISTEDAAEADKIYNALSEGGDISMPIGETFFSKRFAMFEDKFGIDWMVNCPKAM